jgi:glucose/arabinose dehydrogenase
MARQYCGAGEPGAISILNPAARKGTAMATSRPRLLLALLSVVSAPVRAQDVPDGIVVEPLATSLSAPTGFDFLPDGRVIYVEQFTARVRVLTVGTGVQTTPVLTVAGVSAGGERGLLGVAVDPRYPDPPYLYLHYDLASPQSIRLSRYTLSGNLTGTGGDLLASPTSRYDVVDGIPDAASNHNGGTVRFGLDGLLYASLGDDASMCSAQTPGFRGVILRLETRTLPPGPGRAFRAQVAPPDNPFASSSDSAARLVAAYGLRNPFRVQLDPMTGDLVIGDVGLLVREELDILSPPGAVGGVGAPLGTNFGWPFFEGTAVGPTTCGSVPPDLVPPIWDYDRTSQANAAVISAGIYRASPGQPRRLPADHEGDLFANDYYSGAFYRLHRAGGVWSIAAPIPGQPSAGHWGEGFAEISDWRIGSDGALWYCRQSTNFAGGTGSIGRVYGPGVVSVPPPAPLAASLRLRVSPAVGTAQFVVRASGAASLHILDTAGRVVRRIALVPAGEAAGPGGLAAGAERTLVWDGRDEAGGEAPPGVYVAFLDMGAGKSLSRHVVLLR